LIDLLQGQQIIPFIKRLYRNILKYEKRPYLGQQIIPFKDLSLPLPKILLVAVRNHERDKNLVREKKGRKRGLLGSI